MRERPLSGIATLKHPKTQQIETHGGPYSGELCRCPAKTYWRSCPGEPLIRRRPQSAAGQVSAGKGDASDQPAMWNGAVRALPQGIAERAEAKMDGGTGLLVRELTAWSEDRWW